MTEAMTLRADERQQQAVAILSAEAASYRGGVAFDGHQIEVAVRAMLAFAALSRPPADREAVALALINENRRFMGFSLFDGLEGLKPHQYRDQLRYADAILALIAGEGK